MLLGFPPGRGSDFAPLCKIIYGKQETMSGEHVARLSGIEIITRMRDRDLAEFSAEHDDDRGDHELILAAVAYALDDGMRSTQSGVPLVWPWNDDEWHPCPDDRIKELAKAGSLIAAAIDVLQREAALGTQGASL